ncbi:GspH/FimT family pseudopilin [Guyparkeria sp.]|uniref:GspH/FimT family pseudopilin n=1 Tax=Guyparkeria sp. TaxID=2035736 RepID=UPI00356694FF
MLKEERPARRRAGFSRGHAGSWHGAAGGFSLIELMVAVTVAAVLLAIAIPAFSSMMARNQLAAASNDLRGALMSARQAAVMQGRPVSLCAGTPETGCSGDWSRGEWLVFHDADHDGDLGADEKLVRHGQAVGGGGAVVIDGNGPLRTALVYVPLGHAERVSGAFGAGRLRVCVPRDISPNANELVISISGRVRRQSLDFDGECPAL